MGTSRNSTRKFSQKVVLSALISAVALTPTIPGSANVGGSSWTYTGSLNTPQAFHRATLLPNGRVLVVGGLAELYDPQTGTWSNTGKLNKPRWGFTATQLGNGKVLVAGGSCETAEATNAAELYDAATGEWSFTGNLTAPRAGHTATLLFNGKVLIAGGVLGGASSATNTAELYDPVTGTWSLTGNLNGTRDGHAATRLQDGKVLVTGGCMDSGECFTPLGTAELFDQETGTWSITGRPNVVRDFPTLTTLPNGNVLLLKGLEPPTINTPELYNPVDGRWSYTGLPFKHRAQATTTLLPNGQVLVAGGGSSAEVLNSAENYDPNTGKWNATASLNAARRGHTATLLNNGKVLIAAGSDHPNMFSVLRSAELYTTAGSETLATVSAASYHSTGLSSDSIAASFGTSLATTSIAADTLALPTEIAGTTVKVKDSAATERLALLLFVSPTQVNYQIPVGTALGAATVTITSGGGSVSSGIVLIKPVAPSLFAANGDGQGVAAALALRVKADGSQSYEEVVQFDAVQNRFIARPIDLGPESDQVYLVLFGTGIRNRRELSSVIASMGSAYAKVSFAGAQPEFGGVDQINVRIPRSLIGRGEVDVLLTVEAQMANPVRIQVK